MKLENLQKATKLEDLLRIINVRINTVEKAKYIQMYGGSGDNFKTSTERMKYDSKTLIQSLRPLFLASLNREKEDILNEIKALD
tara:strand:- start:359 stop:610 length:252 start_codon:yes stop_codon:yes gene_type:complete